jgi:hypothetical protein
MFEIVETGTVETEKQVMELSLRYGKIVIPTDGDKDLTHWWIIREEGSDALYLGTPETFAAYTKEQNGGVQ